MIAEEDIKAGAIVLHLGSPDVWDDHAALKDSHFVISDIDNSSGHYFTKDTVYIQAVKSNKDLFSLAVPADDIARPVLAERKVGKVPMHMVVDGFPSALREVAKVMGWAGEVKGYKLHDWRSLPDADVEFPSAGYRHMFDNSEMKAQGLSALERVDQESHLVHLAHECFNKLAELELILTGKIK